MIQSMPINSPNFPTSNTKINTFAIIHASNCSFSLSASHSIRGHAKVKKEKKNERWMKKKKRKKIVCVFYMPKKKQYFLFLRFTSLTCWIITLLTIFFSVVISLVVFFVFDLPFLRAFRLSCTTTRPRQNFSIIL